MTHYPGILAVLEAVQAGQSAHTTATPRPMTVAEYERLVFSDQDRQWELHDGQPREKPGKSWDHLVVVADLAFILGRQLDRREFHVFMAGRVRLPDATVFIPDILVVPTTFGREFRGRPEALAIFPAPLPLVVEVWSPPTGAYDVDAKLPVYEPRGDREIWRIHPYEKTLTAWRLQPDGSYDEAVCREGSVETAMLPGVSIQLAELFDN